MLLASRKALKCLLSCSGASAEPERLPPGAVAHWWSPSETHSKKDFRQGSPVAPRQESRCPENVDLSNRLESRTNACQQSRFLSRSDRATTNERLHPLRPRSHSRPFSAHPRSSLRRLAAELNECLQRARALRLRQLQIPMLAVGLRFELCEAVRLDDNSAGR